MSILDLLNRLEPPTGEELEIALTVSARYSDSWLAACLQVLDGIPKYKTIIRSFRVFRLESGTGQALNSRPEFASRTPPNKSSMDSQVKFVPSE